MRVGFLMLLVFATPISVFAQTLFDVSMDGAQAGTASSFTGGGTVTLNAAEDEITVSVTHDIPSGQITGGHIHIGATGVSGGIVFGLSGGGVSPIAESFPISPSQVATLKANGYYLNIHTNLFLNGEIRGQLIAAPVSEDWPSIPPGAPSTSTWGLIALSGALVLLGTAALKRATALSA